MNLMTTAKNSFVSATIPICWCDTWQQAKVEVVGKVCCFEFEMTFLWSTRDGWKRLHTTLREGVGREGFLQSSVAVVSSKWNQWQVLSKVSNHCMTKETSAKTHWVTCSGSLFLCTDSNPLNQIKFWWQTTCWEGYRVQIEVLLAGC